MKSLLKYIVKFPSIKSQDALTTWFCKVTLKVKYVISAKPQALRPLNLARWWVAIKYVFTCGHVTDWICYASTTTISLVIKCSKVGACYEGFPTVKAHNHLNTWTFVIMGQVKNVLSPLSQFLKPAKLGRSWIRERGPQP